MIKAGVIGDPISHSLSPEIHNYLLKKYAINGRYEAILVKNGEFEDGVRKIINEGFSGFNVTIPHKETAFHSCKFLSKTAKETKAVNTVVITEGGELFGHNSDVEGFLRNLTDHCPNFDLIGKKVGIIGAGGAARAIIYGLISSGVKEIIISNRSEERAKNLISDFPEANLKFLNKVDFAKEVPSFDLLVNSTSLGMLKQDPLDIDLTNLKQETIVYDIVYNPLMTELLQHARNNGNQIVTGIGMLINQALIGFELWFKTKPEIDDELVKLLSDKFV